MFKGMSANTRLLIVVLLLTISAVLFTYWRFNTVAAIGISIVIFLVLIITRPLWAPSGATRVRLLSLTGIFAIGGSYGIWAPFADAFIKGLAKSPDWIEKYPWLKDVSIDSEPSLPILIFVLVSVYFVNYFMAKDETLTGKHPDPIEIEFPEIGYQKKLEAFANHLSNRLKNIDRETNWSPEYYTELDADVEVRSSTNRIIGRRVTNLLSAVRSDKKTPGFLILGDPGAGKSVALRKLSLKMLEEVQQTKRVPIYVNLREWMPKQDENEKQAWSEHNKPTVKDLYEFVVATVIADDDVFTEDFVNAYFKRMWEHGRLFFILDSFDEIPQLLDEGEDSWLNEHLSGLIWTLIAEKPNSRGLLASRFFRRPTDAFQASKILEIRPLSDEKIIDGLARFPSFGTNLQGQLFRERHDLVPIARNPFLMTLLGVWVQEHNSLPDNQSQIYDSYLRGRLVLCQRKLTEKKLTGDDLLAAATTIAWFLFESKVYGLEAPISILAEHTGITEAAAIMDILAYGRIGRIGAGEKKTFAFVHRRFLEYLAVQKLITTPELAPIGDIPTDSRGRDALVLYAQVVETQEAERLACYCWNQILENFENKNTRLRAVHSIRFLSDAFRARKECLHTFQDKLAIFIELSVKEGGELLIAKLCLEATGLLTEDRVEPILKYAMSSGNEWLQETAFKACRHMPQLSKEMKKALKAYLWEMPLMFFWSIRKNLIFSLSLSVELNDILRTVKTRTLDIKLFSVGIILIVCFYPKFALLILLFWLILIIFGARENLSAIDSLFNSIRVMPKTMSTTWGMIYFTNFLLGNEQNQLKNITFTGVIVVCVVCILILPCAKAIDMPINYSSSLRSFFLIKKIKAFLQSLIFLMVCLAFLSLCFWVGTIYVPKWLQMPIVYTIMGIIGIGLFCLIFASVPNIIKDYMYFHRLKLRDRLTRAEICNILSSIKTDKYQTSFVHMLSERKVIATGEWPEDFSLSSRTNSAITQLAKLEEKWLGLDR
jgi:hypothetical protein